MAKIKCNCGKPAKTRIYTDQDAHNFVDRCEKCAEIFRQELDVLWEDRHYRQGRSMEHYLSNFRTMELVFLLGGIIALIITAICIVKILF
jgi:hypothetical protein